MPRKFIDVVVNRDGGSAAALGAGLEDRLSAAFREAGCEARIQLVGGNGVTDAVSQSSTPVVAVGGGDGTLAAAANVLIPQGKTLAVLPLGTRNHFAKQIGLSGDLDEAAGIAVKGRRVRVDVGSVDSRIFLNNASLGLYTRMVRERDRRTGPKWLRTIPAAWQALQDPEARHYSVEADGTVEYLRSPLIFIGNNRYLLDRGNLGQRARLDEGVMSLFAVAPKSSRELLSMALRSALGKIDLSADFTTLGDATRLTISGSGTQDVALDGEIERMKLPIKLEVLPKALSVLVPSATFASQPLPLNDQ